MTEDMKERLIEKDIIYSRNRIVSAGQRERARERMQGINSNDTWWMKIV